MDCPKCDANRIFKADYMKKDRYDRSDGVYEFRHPRYQCLSCGHKFDTVPIGEFLILDKSNHRLM